MEPERVTPEEVMGRLNRGERVFFVDTRQPEAWEGSDVKLPGAIRDPPDDVEAHLADVPRDRTIVTYCT